MAIWVTGIALVLQAPIFAGLTAAILHFTPGLRELQANVKNLISIGSAAISAIVFSALGIGGYKTARKIKEAYSKPADDQPNLSTEKKDG